jgi:uncharacterized short protein YbdD (DUF466 family)
LDGILGWAKKQDQENTTNQKAEWTNKKWDLHTVTAALVKSGLGGHLLAALKEGGVKIKAGGKLRDNVWVSYCDVDEKTIYILPEFDSATAADTLVEEAKHAVDGMKKRSEMTIIDRLIGSDLTPQERYDLEFSAHLARIIVFQDLLSADAKIGGNTWQKLLSHSTEEIEMLEQGKYGVDIYDDYMTHNEYKFSSSAVTTYEPFTDSCIKEGKQ